MIRSRPVGPASLSAARVPPGTVRVGSGSVLSADIGEALAVLVRHEPTGQGGFCVVAGDVSAFTDCLDTAVASLSNRLRAMGVPLDETECAVLGGNHRSPWQVRRATKRLAEGGWSPKELDILGDTDRFFAFDLSSGMTEIASVARDPDSWKPSSGALSASDSARVFADSRVTGVVANATRFFREERTFAGLREVVVPEHLADRPDAPLTVWCAACSSGAEAYSYAMYLLRLRERTGASFPVRVVGTDINDGMIERARNGVYEAPPREIEEYGAYFRRYGEVDGLRITFGDEVRACVRFGVFDISRVPKSHRFRVVICANVFQYYNNEARRAFLANFLSALERPGYVHVGAVAPELVEGFPVERLARWGFLRAVST